MSELHSESFERRDALKLGGAWFVAGSLPWWWGCSADSAPLKELEPVEGIEPVRGGSPLERAVERARQNGKPILVFVTTEPPATWSQLATDVGELFHAGGDELLLDVALAELVCASPTQLAAWGVTVAPDAVGLLERQGATQRWSPIAWIARATGSDRWESNIEIKDRARRNIVALRTALAGSKELLAEREHSARAALSREWLADFERRIATRGALDPSRLHFAAAVARGSARWSDLRPDMLRRVREQVLGAGPGGARWVHFGDCGIDQIGFLPTDSDGVRFDLGERLAGRPPAPRDVDGQPYGSNTAGALGALCGMAYGGDRSTRFLAFYVDEP